MKLPMIWLRAGCLCGAGVVVAIGEEARSGAVWDASDPWCLAAIAAATAVAAALGRTIYGLIHEHGRPKR